MSIISSRRNFLKLFGASAAVVAAAAVLPVNPVVIEATVGPLPLKFPPNVLHVNLDGVWTALSEVVNINMHEYVYDSVAGHLGKLPIKPYRGYVDTTIDVTSIFRGENHHLFEQLGHECGHRRYAFSTSEQIYEYDALMMSDRLSVTFGVLPTRSNHFAIISDVQVSQNG